MSEPQEGPTGRLVPDGGDDEAPLAELRADLDAVDELPVAERADRFEAVNDALVAELGRLDGV